VKIYKKAILPNGFMANGVASGIKKTGKLDLALFYSLGLAKAACKFTANKIQAAPIKLNKRYLKSNKYFQAIIANSGNANCFNGRFGLRDAQETTKELARNLKINKQAILVASTGIIGRRLPLLKIKQAIPQLAQNISREGIRQAKRAIMTTDTFIKEITLKFEVGNKMVTICGIAKGSGMIAPHMATMLCFIFTDASITQGALNKALKIAVDESFNCITVDGCMSTNDSVILLANGASGNNTVDTNKYFSLFRGALSRTCLELAKMIVKDGEGASKFIQIKVGKAKSFSEAKRIALGIANSNLFKTAIYGENPNFGRVVAAVGASGINVQEKDLKVKVSPLNKKEINIDVSINRGNSSAIVYTSDLTPEYVKINAGYN
jgi:glutamate N-acetyltransferase/amino-acid N-acetyltransferase